MACIIQTCTDVPCGGAAEIKSREWARPCSISLRTRCSSSLSSPFCASSPEVFHTRKFRAENRRTGQPGTNAKRSATPYGGARILRRRGMRHRPITKAQITAQQRASRASPFQKPRANRPKIRDLLLHSISLLLPHYSEIMLGMLITIL